MNARPVSRRTVLTCALLALGSLSLAASAEAAGKKNPTSKLYVTDVEGKAEIDTGERIEDITKKSVYTAQGTVIETKPNATNAMVFSNGAGVFFDPDTRIEVKRFVQEPFSPNRTDLEVEPSISQTQISIARGAVGLCTSKLVAGSRMVYSTPHASVSIRGKKVVIEADEYETRISLLEGDVTVRGGDSDVGGQTLRGGQQAVIRRPPGEPPTFQVQPIPDAQQAALDDKVSQACMARRTVYFEVADRKDENDPEASPESVFATDDEPGQEIEPVEVVPADLPVQFTISPSSK
ncbi:MAG TPA: hypothetical protein VGD81_15605 [Opitutaceae bacterium]